MKDIKDYLIKDIKSLNNHDAHKLYKYVRRYLIAKIEGLIDPLEHIKNLPTIEINCPHFGKIPMLNEDTGIEEELHICMTKGKY